VIYEHPTDAIEMHVHRGGDFLDALARELGVDCLTAIRTIAANEPSA
jgi:hypothetical protein